mgnify:CR=1 FL=1
MRESSRMRWISFGAKAMNIPVAECGLYNDVLCSDIMRSCESFISSLYVDRNGVISAEAPYSLEQLFTNLRLGEDSDNSLGIEVFHIWYLAPSYCASSENLFKLLQKSHFMQTDSQSEGEEVSHLPFTFGSKLSDALTKYVNYKRSVYLWQAVFLAFSREIELYQIDVEELQHTLIRYKVEGENGVSALLEDMLLDNTEYGKLLVEVNFTEVCCMLRDSLGVPSHLDLHLRVQSIYSDPCVEGITLIETRKAGTSSTNGNVKLSPLIEDLRTYNGQLLYNLVMRYHVSTLVRYDLLIRNNVEYVEDYYTNYYKDPELTFSIMEEVVANHITDLTPEEAKEYYIENGEVTLARIANEIEDEVNILSIFWFCSWIDSSMENGDEEWNRIVRPHVHIACMLGDLIAEGGNRKKLLFAGSEGGITVQDVVNYPADTTNENYRLGIMELITSFACIIGGLEQEMEHFHFRTHNRRKFFEVYATMKDRMVQVLQEANMQHIPHLWFDWIWNDIAEDILRNIVREGCRREMISYVRDIVEYIRIHHIERNENYNKLKLLMRGKEESREKERNKSLGVIFDFITFVGGRGNSRCVRELIRRLYSEVPIHIEMENLTPILLALELSIK